MDPIGTSHVTLRANYWKPIAGAAIVGALIASLLLAGVVPVEHLWWAASILLLTSILLLALLLASAFDVIVLTPEQFGLAFYVTRRYTKWSDVSPFYVLDKRVLGIRIRGVAFSYVRPFSNFGIRRKPLRYDRVIDSGFGEPSELARLLNRYREEYMNRQVRQERKQ